ncbi:hypothetical protein HNQ85_001660 [Anoxybacillus calidus]|jgi:lantibiotic leader peptide-processing serine protease|uniref:Peptidase S8/S53 domain-containing protein n=1 Tax=[Anoxybacillus] calidus TaxID=575178 RepID=A0A7W0BVC4_9BACL|nr:S8 family serine peptidase [Anoxybacillus calidus]MBA2871390.1 hypothetical protein [Anoxybacillus calidus]
MKRLLFKLTISLLVIFSIYVFPIKEIHAKDQPKYKQIIVFYDSKIPDDFIKLLNQNYKNVKTTIIPEIGVIKLENSLPDIVETLKEKFPNEIQYIGPETEFIVPWKGELTNQTTETYQLKSIVKSSFSSSKLEEAELYELFGWDIKKITENGESFNKQKGSHKVKIAIIDSGIDFNHPDLKNNIVSPGKSFVPNVHDTEDNIGHGTMIAGTIAANGKMLGVGPHLGIVPYKVMDNWEDGAESAWIVKAIIEAANDGVDVINLSLGTYKSLNSSEDKAVIEAYQRAVKYAHDKGVIVVASAGNDGLDLRNPKKLAEQRGFPNDKQLHLPGGGIHFLLTVAATNKNDERSFYSNYGNISVAAPGGDYGPEWLSQQKLDPFSLTLTTYPIDLPKPILSQILNLPDGYVLTGGTSVSSSKVAGAIGVLIAEQKEKNTKKLTLSMVKKILRESSTDIGKKGKDPEFGYGLINVNKALELIK